MTAPSEAPPLDATAVEKPPLRAAAGNDSSSVQVAIRVRPMLPSEAGSTQCIDCLCSSSSKDSSSERPCVVRIGGESGPTFAFDEAFPGSSCQKDVFETRVVPLVESCLEGYNATVLAYGQTGSGKTHTIMGPPSSAAAATMHDDATAGVIPRALRNLFDELEQTRQQNKENNDRRCSPLSSSSSEENRPPYEYEVRVQFLELYGEEIRDLLSPPTSGERLTIRDVGLDEPEVLGATQHKIETAEEAILCLTRGMLRRVTGATAMNASSSRSHAILSVLIEQTTVLEDNSNTTQERQQHVQVKRSKFNFVDLAGSERQKRTRASGQRLKEGIDINKGLLVLGNVISALGDVKKRGAFVPYRDSKLTRLLKGSLGGNHKTLMIACVSPSSNNLEESLNCLRYANRAKNIQNNAVVNVDAGSRLVGELRVHVQALATELLRVRNVDDDDDSSNFKFTIEMLESLASGGTDSSVGASVPATSNSVGGISGPAGLASPKESFRTAQSDTDADGDSHIASIPQFLLEELPSSAIERANKVLDEEKAHLTTIQNALSRSFEASPARGSLDNQGEDRPDSPELVRLRSAVFQSISHTDQLDAEEAAEQAELKAIANRFLEGEDEMHQDEQDGAPLQGDPIAALHEDSAENDDSFHRRRQQQMEAHLLELSKSIDAKEELIRQLHISQEKYATMREFYEEKLQQMEEQVNLKEAEREELVSELKKMEKTNSCTKDLQQRLKMKEEHIAGLRRKQRELLGLTKVSSRNESEIDRLRNDVLSMKHKKVELQKQITSDRKHYTSEIQKLKKHAMQSEREANKWKKVSDRKTLVAENAQRVAKSRLEQVGQLRTKYKEAEKQLRIKTVKRGVMEKAGLDPVMVGRKETGKKNNRSTKQPDGGKGKGQSGSIDVNAMRECLDSKVADVGRKEAIADKLAIEWEEHLELVSRKEELSQVHGDEAAKEDMGALDVQLQYKEERIRQLGRRLGKLSPASSDEQNSTEASFLDDSEFKSLCPGHSPLSDARMTSKVLFGMVVRERRRVAALARTASSLDEKVVEAQKAVAEKDAAFRSYMEEERHERAIIAQNQQQQIMSLMAMVQEEEDFREKVRGSPKSIGLVLANERMSVLEQQLSEREGEREATEAYKAKEAEANALLATKTQECEDLEQELHRLRSSFEQIREAAARDKSRRIRERKTQSGKDGADVSQESLSFDSDTEPGGRMHSGEVVLDIATKALHPAPRKIPGRGRTGAQSERANAVSQTHSPRFKRHVELMHSSDSDTDGDVPEWAGDIMADLAQIANEEVPANAQKSNPSDGSVFDRLSDPGTFTGVQKQKSAGKVHQRRSKAEERGSKAVPAAEQTGRSQRNAMSRIITDSLDKVAEQIKSPSAAKTASTNAEQDPHDDADQSTITPKASGSTANSAANFSSQNGESRDEVVVDKVADRRSVFERLMSPSSYTGVQKAAAHDQKLFRDEETDKMLDELLANDKVARAARDEETDKLLDELLEDDLGNSPARLPSKVADYTRQDVFERLQRTTTQSYAVKQHAPVIRNFSDHSLPLSTKVDADRRSPPTPPEAVASSPPTEANSEYIHLNVFERLQKTTTQAYAGKKQHSLPSKHSVGEHDACSGVETTTRPKSVGRARPSSTGRAMQAAGKKHASSARNNFSVGEQELNSGDEETAREGRRVRRSNSTGRAHDARQDVFERLQRTTTQAYAVKHHVAGKMDTEESDRSNN